MIQKKVKNKTTDDSKINETIGEFFRTARIKKGISISELADFAEIKEPIILKNYEEGKKPIPLQTIYALANILDIPPDKIVELFYQVCLPGELKKRSIK